MSPEEWADLECTNSSIQMSEVDMQANVSKTKWDTEKKQNIYKFRI